MSQCGILLLLCALIALPSLGCSAKGGVQSLAQPSQNPPAPPADLSIDLTSSLPSSVRFQRNSEASYFDANGLLKKAGPGTPRFDYDPRTLQPLGLLIEPLSANLLVASEALEQSSDWLPSGASVTANVSAGGILSPDGTATAEKLVENTANSFHGVIQTVNYLGASRAATLSVFARKASNDWLILLTKDKSGTQSISYFNLAQARLGSRGTAHSAQRIQQIGSSGWYRCSVTFNTGSGSNPNEVGFFLAPSDGSFTFAGDGTSAVYVWGAQVEDQPTVTSYMGTSPTSLTLRQADDLTFASFSFINRLAGSWLFDLHLPALSGVPQTVFALGNKADDTMMSLNLSTALESNFTYMKNGTSLASLPIGGRSWSDGQAKSVAFSYDQSGVIFTEDGQIPVTVTGDATLPAGKASSARIGRHLDVTTFRDWPIHIKKIRYWQTKKTPAELKALTAPSSSTLSVQQIGQGTYNSWPYQFFKISKPGFTPTYVQYFPPQTGTESAVLYTLPYSAITWSDQQVDRDWTQAVSSTTPGFQNDVTGPFYEASTSKQIVYYVTPPNDAGDLVLPYLRNEMGVAISFSRFYQGGSLQNELDDSLLAYEFLSSRSGVNPEKIGIYGSSLGGFEALYTSAHTSLANKPLVGVALSPLSDVDKFARHDLVELPASGLGASQLAQFQNFYEPYLRRIYATTQGSPLALPENFQNFSTPYLVNHLTTPFLIFHDEWDSIIPIAHSQALVSALPSTVSGFWFYQPSPLDLTTASITHNLETPGSKYWAIYLMTEAYMLTRLLPSSLATIYAYYSLSDIDTFMASLRTLQTSGKDVSFAVPRLIELCDPRLILVDSVTTSNPDAAGADVFAQLLNAHWGTSLTGANVKAYLENNGLPP